MLLKIFTVYDSKTEAYLSPFYMQSTGQALRSFEDTVNDANTQFHKHAADFTLFEIGTFDDSNAQFQLHAAKTNLGSANEYIKVPGQPPQLAVAGE